MKLIKEQKQELNNNKNGLTVYPRMNILLFDCVVLIMLMKTYKTKLNLNNKQRTQFFKNAGLARFAYNLALQMQEDNYKNGGKFLSDCDIRKQITLLKQTNLKWLYQYDVDIVKQAVNFDNWKFVGCSNLKWKWVIEIENCPLQEDNQ